MPAKETVNAVRSGAVGGGTTSISFTAGLVRPLSGADALSLSELGLDVIEHFDPRKLGKADFLLILNRNESIAPAVAKMSSVEQAVAYFMLGETKGTSAGGAAEAPVVAGLALVAGVGDDERGLGSELEGVAAPIVVAPQAPTISDARSSAAR